MIDYHLPVLCRSSRSCVLFFFFNDPATTEIYTLSLHDALPICCSSGSPQSWACPRSASRSCGARRASHRPPVACAPSSDRKSTRLNSSHVEISYAVFCLKKKKIIKNRHIYLHRLARLRS